MTARPFIRTGFRAFRIGESGRAYEVRVDGAPATVAEAVASVQALCLHKEHLAVRETDVVGAGTRLHLYVIKQQSRPTYVQAGLVQKRVRSLYAEHVVTLAGPVLTGAVAEDVLALNRRAAPALAHEAAR